MPELWTEQEPWTLRSHPGFSHSCPPSLAGMTCQWRMLIVTEPLLTAGNDTEPLVGDKEQ